jgi:hypothetical protein
MLQSILEAVIDASIAVLLLKIARYYRSVLLFVAGKAFDPKQLCCCKKFPIHVIETL